MKQKLFLPRRAKVTQCLEILSCSDDPTAPYPPTWTFTLFNSCLSVCIPCACVNKLHSALLCWDLLVGIQGCNHFASVVGSVLRLKACTGTEGAASSKYRIAKVNYRLKRLKDTILIYLFLTLFLPMHSMHCLKPCTYITYSSSCEAHVCFTYALV